MSAWAKILGRTERIGRREIDFGPKELQRERKEEVSEEEGEGEVEIKGR